ncbi:MAG: hypothetical protein K0B14_18345, partial [Anaerolineaceae bacterium]|nr:hypothetical protein [Anaerolineaceae bacterium]
MKKTPLLILVFVYLSISLAGQNRETKFLNPPDSHKPWVFWFWINGNISREGITRDLEAMKRVGINGVLWMEVSGPFWAPTGNIVAGTQEWDEMMQWAITEADRLGMEFDMTVDFGYGSGGPHISPKNSMKKLVWSETLISGGESVSLNLKKPLVDYQPMLDKVWLRPGEELSSSVLEDLEEIDSYDDIAVFAIKSPWEKKSRIEDQELYKYDGRGYSLSNSEINKFQDLIPVSNNSLIDLTDLMGNDGKLNWSAPEGNWTIIRFGFASNFQMTRPCPGASVGLECDRLNTDGIDAHFE